MNLWDLHQQYIVELDPILWEMGRVNGIHINNEARLELLTEMNTKVDGEVRAAQPYPPENLFPLKRYKNKPETERPIREIQVPNDKVKTCAACGQQHITKTEHTARRGGKNGTPINACYKAEIILTPGIDTEYDVVLPFNPGSDDQLKAYADYFKHKLGRNWKTGEDTLDAKHVQKLINKYGVAHPIYRHALEIRKIRKARGYAQAWIPNEYGLAFGEYTHVPETLRLSQRRHNFQNVSHRGNVPYADELRRLLIAPPGYLLLEADSSSIEAVFSGKLMGSQRFMEIARKGLHSWWALKNLGKEFTDENVKWIKNAKEHSVLYDTKKRTAYLALYKGGAMLVHGLYPETFRTKASAQAEIDDLYALMPEITEWHQSIIERAYKQGYLQSRWGFRNYYYRVLSYDYKTKKHKEGDDAKAAIAFEPQHSNAMFQRENLKLIHRNIEKMGKRGKWFLTAIGQVHDSNGMRVPEDDRDKAGQMMAEVMNRPIKQMDNIQIGVQVKAGKNWGDMEAFLTLK